MRLSINRGERKMTHSLAEKIETIWNSKKSGTFGAFYGAGKGRAIIMIDGRKFDVSVTHFGYDVLDEATSFVGSGSTVFSAAYLAINP